MSQVNEFAEADTAGTRPPRFGSYLGLFFIVGILGALSLALIRNPGTGHAFAGLKPGMTPTEVAAVLGVPRSETKSGSQFVQTWRMPDGVAYEVRFQDGKLIAKERTAKATQAR